MLNGQSYLLARYQYDALDRLIGQYQRNSSVSQRFYCERRLSTEINGGDGHSIFQHDEQVLAQHKHAGGRLHSSLLGADMQGSVLHLLHPNDPHSRGYSAYGFHPIQNILTPTLGFNGQRPDPVTRHYLLGNGYRAFNPILMRFNSPDSLSPFHSGGLNAYAYCQGDPVNNSDPSGRTLQSRVILQPENMFKGMVELISKTHGDELKLLSNYKSIAPGLSVGVDTYKGTERLNIIGHGNKGFLALDENLKIEPRGLLKLLEVNGINAKGYKNIRVAACFSAEGKGASPSFAQIFANLTEARVKGFYGVPGAITAKLPRINDEGWAVFGMIKGRTPQSQAALKKGSGDYRRRVFSPEQPLPSASLGLISKIRK